MVAAQIDHRRLYRLPWSLADNPIVWLEPTEHCNLACDGCYRKNSVQHKTLAQVDEDLDVFTKLRTFDSVSIAGGDPLMHPDIVEIVRRIAKRGVKPILNTNGHALTRELLRDLKRAGVSGFTFHVDSKQGRPDWRGKDEIAMNELRSIYAEMLAEVGGLTCSFNSTVYPDTLHQVPDIAAWAHRNIDKVHSIVFIIFRHADLSSGRYDYWAGGTQVHMDELVYAEKEQRRIDIVAQDVVGVLRERDPDFMPCAYLNGSEKPDSFKWLLSLRVGTKERIFGYSGAKFMEGVQSVQHFLYNRYVAYSAPKTLSHGKGAMALGATFDRGLRGALGRFAQHLVRNPMDIVRPTYTQSVLIIQPIDILQDGRQSMCDGCPDMTVHEGQLVWSCRLEELKKYGSFVRTVPRTAPPA